MNWTFARQVAKASMNAISKDWYLNGVIVLRRDGILQLFTSYLINVFMKGVTVSMTDENIVLTTDLVDNVIINMISLNKLVVTQYVTCGLIIVFIWCLMWSIIGEEALPPDGSLFNVLLVFVLAYICGQL
ncbi:unnamed protein product, partial [Oppiella nova]